MAYDSTRQRIVMFGGWGGGAETCEWDGSTWSQTTTVVAPTWRHAHGMAFDGIRQRVVLFGGSNYQGMQSDTWEWDGGMWTPAATPVSPAARLAFGLAYDQQGLQVVLFGGRDGSGEFGDTWQYGPQLQASYVPFGSGCAGSGGVPSLGANLGSLPRIGTTFTALLMNTGTNPFANFPFLVIGESNTSWGSGPLPFGLGSIGMPGCTLYIRPTVSQLLFNQGGAATWSFAIPSDATLAGVSLYTQGAVMMPAANPLGLVVSNACTMQIGW